MCCLYYAAPSPRSQSQRSHSAPSIAIVNPLHPFLPLSFNLLSCCKYKSTLRYVTLRYGTRRTKDLYFFFSFFALVRIDSSSSSSSNAMGEGGTIECACSLRIVHTHTHSSGPVGRVAAAMAYYCVQCSALGCASPPSV